MNTIVQLPVGATVVDVQLTDDEDLNAGVALSQQDLEEGYDRTGEVVEPTAEEIAAANRDFCGYSEGNWEPGECVVIAWTDTAGVVERRWELWYDVIRYRLAGGGS